MNYLIVVPRIVSNSRDFYQFPQGFAYISSVLIQSGFKILKLNLNHISIPVYSAMKNAIINYKVDVLLTGGLTGQYGAIRTVIEGAKRLKKEIITVVGGGIITSAPVLSMQALEFADYGVIGEGEIIICELCHALEKNTSVELVPGVVYKKGEQFIVTEGKPVSVDVNSIPFPDYEGFGLEELLTTVPNIVGMGEYNNFPIITSRGCPFKCTFCFHPSGQRFRQRDLNNVFNEIDYLLQKYDIRYLSVQDELFSHNIERVKEFCYRIKPYNIKWNAQFRVTDVTQELVKILKEANCVTLQFGIESADNRILKSMNKRITIEETNRALDIVYDAGLGIQGALIFGDIAETLETAKNTLNWWKEHIYYGLQLSVVNTYPGSELFKYACKEKLIKDPIQFIKDSCPTIKLSKMAKEEYTWMIEQIISLQRMTLSLPKKIESISIDYDKACMDLDGVCSSCNTLNSWSKVRLFIAESLTCKNCGRRHYLPIPDSIVNKIKSNIDKLILQYEKICFWGINSSFYELCKKMNLSNTDQILYVDKSEIRQGVNIFGGKIQSTDVISTKEIKCIIVTVPQYYTSISPMIELEFPHVKKTVNILHLLADRFNCD